MDRADGEEVRTEMRALIERVAFLPHEGLGKADLQVREDRDKEKGPNLSA
jgi:hypothetical protein